MFRYNFNFFCLQDQEDEEAEKRNIEGDRRAIADLMKTHVNEVTPQVCLPANERHASMN